MAIPIDVSGKTQSAAAWVNLGSAELVEVPCPKMNAGDILIEVEASGLCATDHKVCGGHTPSAARNVIIGHEYAGTIVASHPETHTQLALGDRIAVNPNIYCQACVYCHSARVHLCQNLRALGITTHGGMEKYAVVPISQAVFVPPHVSPEAASLAEPLSCVLHAFDKGNVRTGHDVLVVGAGPVGCMLNAIVRAAGARCTVMEPNPARRKIVKEDFSADEVVDLDALPGCDGRFDVVFECVGRTDAMENALTCARPGGTVVWVGVARPDAVCKINPYLIYARELTLRSSFTNPYTMQRAVRFLADGGLNVEKFVTHKFSLEDFPKAWEAFERNDGLKICVMPNKSSAEIAAMTSN
ncbi:GroES-like protein [Caulochytrium protostelioides]|uniref:GroES-like protein n=1 Tax=Caulochytrium protostelioides TaxID=1555241 RepID=A0A4P9WUW6_9FUNG|nr:GroES-like protein [Caulochytrium protostelioides]